VVLLAGLCLEHPLRRRVAHPERAHPGRRIRQLGVGTEALLHRVHEGLVLDVPGGGYDDVGADVPGAVVVAHRSRVDPVDRVGGADHRPAQRMAREDSGCDQIVCEVVVAVLVHRDLLEHDLPLGRQLGRVERGREQHVAHHVEGGLEVRVEDAGIDDGVLLGGGRVQLAAEPVEHLRDLGARVARGPLEQEVLDEMADAGATLGLVTRAGADPEAECNRAH